MNPREFFNMKYSSARNCIKRAFGILKGWWAILRGKSFYPMKVQCRIIKACCLVHNLITREMSATAMFKPLDDSDSPISELGANNMKNEF